MNYRQVLASLPALRMQNTQKSSNCPFGICNLLVLDRPPESRALVPGKIADSATLSILIASPQLCQND